MLTLEDVEKRFYSNLGVDKDEIVTIPTLTNSGSFNYRNEPVWMHYAMLEYCVSH